MKRARSTSPNHNNVSLYSGASEPTTKFQRIEQKPTEEKELLWCTLEPTCAPPNEPTCLRNLDELEAHYTQYHAFVCRAAGCTCVFPNEHYLSLHQTELHDPLAQIRKESGEPIYRCLIEDCPQVLQSPNQRKRHLVQEHQFDDKFFFAVTKVGIGGQLRAWGSLGGNQNTSSKRSKETKMMVDPSPDESQGTQSANQKQKKQNNRRSMNSTPQNDPMVDDLTNSMKNVALIPSAIRFGRGGANKGGFERPSHKKRNASLSDIKFDKFDKKEDMPTEDDFGPEENSENEDAPTGVRFAEEVAIRFLSPIDRRYNEGRRGKRKYPGKKGARPGGVHSDDESGSRSARIEGRSTGFRGRGRGRGKPAHAA